MSVVDLPSIRSYWSNNMGNHVIKNEITGNIFEKIVHFLRLINSKLTCCSDRLYKIRPLIEVFRINFISIPLEECPSVDEQICATKKAHYLEQFVPRKLHNWSYKLFGTSCFAYGFEVYSGQYDSDVKQPDLGACANIVVRLVRKISDGC